MFPLLDSSYLYDFVNVILIQQILMSIYYNNILNILCSIATIIHLILQILIFILNLLIHLTHLI